MSARVLPPVIVLDPSAVAAICLGEPDAERFVDVLADRAALDNAEIVMSAASFVEAAAVLDRRRPGSFDRVLTALDVRIIAVDAEQAQIARVAYRMFGRGSGHEARLNFGDCFSYALARVTEGTLIFKGDDFSRTDVPCWNPAD